MISYYYKKDLFWFRIFGYGLSCYKNAKFSDRHFKRKKVFGLYWKFLKRDKKKLSFFLRYGDKSIENLLFHLNKVLKESFTGEFYKEEGGALAGVIDKKDVKGWRELKIDVSDFVYLPNIAGERINYAPEKKRLLSSLTEIYKERKKIYIGEWHIHLSGSNETSREDDVNMISKLRFQKYIILIILVKRKTILGDTVYILTPYLYFRKWFKTFKWKLEVMELVVPKNNMTWKYIMRYSGNEEVIYN